MTEFDGSGVHLLGLVVGRSGSFLDIHPTVDMRSMVHVGGDDVDGGQGQQEGESGFEVEDVHRRRDVDGVQLESKVSFRWSRWNVGSFVYPVSNDLESGQDEWFALSW